MSHIIDEDEIYTYGILMEKDLEESVRLIAHTFTKYNPIEAYLKTTYEQFYSYALAIAKATLEDQLSIIAVHKQTKEIHGLATKLQQILLIYCRQRGFKQVFVEVANPATYHIYTKKLKGKEFTSISLPTFISSDGRRPFEDYNGELQLIVFYLQ
ncbi:unnamed protein product [Adineta steineri]|uniref:N-acetyltransferase domain-containing protein n=1 Tax=Adineta steineri TaxID=433720 RepID=A0A815VTC0_9BILA|nr:unnamed protein product [Adineta steineri]CAF1654108.1 unnamed protein product [Adineta steineri]